MSANGRDYAVAYNECSGLFDAYSSSGLRSFGLDVLWSAEPPATAPVRAATGGHVRQQHHSSRNPGSTRRRALSADPSIARSKATQLKCKKRHHTHPHAWAREHLRIAMTHQLTIPTDTKPDSRYLRHLEQIKKIFIEKRVPTRSGSLIYLSTTENSQGSNCFFIIISTCVKKNFQLNTDYFSSSRCKK